MFNKRFVFFTFNMQAYVYYIECLRPFRFNSIDENQFNERQSHRFNRSFDDEWKAKALLNVYQLKAMN